MDFVIERKSFSLKWVGSAGRNLLSVTEKGRLKYFRSFLSKEGGVWLSGILRRAAEEWDGKLISDEACFREKWRDYHATMWGEVCRNYAGSFLRVEVIPVSKRGSPVILCFPGGDNGLGWKLAAESFEKTIGVPTNREGCSLYHQSAQTKSFADVLRNGIGIREEFHSENHHPAESTDGERECSSDTLLRESKIIIKIESWIHKFTVESLIFKLKQVESWVEICSRLEGRWNTSWEDDSASVVVGLTVPVLKDSAMKEQSRREDDDGGTDAQMQASHEIHEPELTAIPAEGDKVTAASGRQIHVKSTKESDSNGLSNINMVMVNSDDVRDDDGIIIQLSTGSGPEHFLDQASTGNRIGPEPGQVTPERDKNTDHVGAARGDILNNISEAYGSEQDTTVRLSFPIVGDLDWHEFGQSERGPRTGKKRARSNYSSSPSSASKEQNSNSGHRFKKVYRRRESRSPAVRAVNKVGKLPKVVREDPLQGRAEDKIVEIVHGGSNPEARGNSRISEQEHVDRGARGVALEKERGVELVENGEMSRDLIESRVTESVERRSRSPETVEKIGNPQFGVPYEKGRAADVKEGGELLSPNPQELQRRKVGAHSVGIGIGDSNPKSNNIVTPTEALGTQRVIKVRMQDKLASLGMMFGVTPGITGTTLEEYVKGMNLE